MRLIGFGKGLVIAATTALIMACGGGSPADKMMGIQEKLLTILEDNKGDLDKAAKEVKAFVDSNKDTMKGLMAEMEKMGEELEKDPEKAAKMMAEYAEKGEKMKARMEALEKEVPAIKEHAGLKEAMMGFMN